MIAFRTIVLIGSAVAVLTATPVSLPVASSANLAFSQGVHAMPSQAPVGRRGRKAKKKFVPAVATPILVRDVRFKAYSDHTRVVLDLQRSTSFTQNRLKNPDRIIIELQNALLGKTAKDRLTETKLPGEIAIAQPHSRSVTISLDMNTISDYKLLPLSRPDRLVVDVFNQAPAQLATAPPKPIVLSAISEPLPPPLTIPAVPNVSIVPAVPPAPRRPKRLCRLSPLPLLPRKSKRLRRRQRP